MARYGHPAKSRRAGCHRSCRFVHDEQIDRKHVTEDVGEKVQPFLCEYENHSRAASAEQLYTYREGEETTPQFPRYYLGVS